MIALSYSRLSTYELCPFKFKSQYLDKDYPDEGDNPHFIKGSKKHKQLENYIKCVNDPTLIPMQYDGDVRSALNVVDKLKANGFTISAEHQLAVDKNWKPVDWFSKAAAYRAILDFIAIKDNFAVIGDWKTGKFRDYDGKDTGQLHCCACVAFSHMDYVDEIQSAYFFIEHKQTVKRRFTREMYNNGLTTPFDEALVTVNEDEEFNAVRNKYCNWCLLKEEGRCPIL